RRGFLLFLAHSSRFVHDVRRILGRILAEPFLQLGLLVGVQRPHVVAHVLKRKTFVRKKGEMSENAYLEDGSQHFWRQRDSLAEVIEDLPELRLRQPFSHGLGGGQFFDRSHLRRIRFHLKDRSSRKSGWDEEQNGNLLEGRPGASPVSCGTRRRPPGA